MTSKLLSNCCSWPVPDLAGDGVGGIDVCPFCGEWSEIVSEDDYEEESKESESNKEGSKTQPK